MLTIRFKRSSATLVLTGVGVSGIVLLLAIVAAPYVLVSLPYTLDAEAVGQRIRHYLKYQASQQYAERYKQGQVDAQLSQWYVAEIVRIDRLHFESVKVGRLLPDYVFSEQGPTFYAKAVIRDADDQVQTRYFNLGTGELVIGESSRLVWLFVF